MANIVRRDPDQGIGSLAPSAFGWDPFRLMREMLSADPFRMLSADPFRTFGGLQQATQTTWMPQLEVKENNEAYVITADLPGMAENDLEINLTGNRLVISGRREAEDRREDDSFITYERSFGSFSRAFVLPDDIDPEGVQAELRNGVLSVKVPKTQESRPRKISIKGLIDKAKGKLGVGSDEGKREEARQEASEASQGQAQKVRGQAGEAPQSGPNVSVSGQAPPGQQPQK